MSINYERVALSDLRTHPQREAALENLQARIAALKAQAEGLRAVSTDKVPVQGGDSRSEERLIDNIVERQRLELNLRAVRPVVAIVRRGLGGLTAEERMILERFAQDGRRGDRTADILAEELHMSRRSVYRLREDALRKFTISCYGIRDL